MLIRRKTSACLSACRLHAVVLDCVVAYVSNVSESGGGGGGKHRRSGCIGCGIPTQYPSLSAMVALVKQVFFSPFASQ